MNLKVIIHKAEEGGYRAEISSIPCCVTQGETVDELLANAHEAAQECLSANMNGISLSEKRQNNGDSRLKAVNGKNFAAYLGKHGWEVKR